MKTWYDVAQWYRFHGFYAAAQACRRGAISANRDVAELIKELEEYDV